MIRPLAVLFIASLSPGVLAQDVAPKVWVDEGACPFECCQYGRWTAETPTPAFASPTLRARQVTVIPRGIAVTAITGHVRTTAQPFVVNRPHDRYKSGDRLMVYTYYGEGAFSVWYKGERYTEDLGFSPYGGTGDKRCTNAKQCWGTLAGELQQDWWVQVRLPDGHVAWVNGAMHFSGADACG